MPNAPLFEEIRAGNLIVRLAQSPEEIESSQRLRYQVFYDEMGGIPTDAMRKIGRDFDVLDSISDHLLVIDSSKPQADQIVGTYRLLRRNKQHSFYSESEYDISLLKKEETGEILELSRSCVHPSYRRGSVIQLLFRGIGTYINLHNIKILFGCASFCGTDVKSHSLPLSYLYHYHTAPEEIRPVAITGRYEKMDLIAKENIDIKEAFAALPALIKGYLRMNGYVGAGAVVDPQFNTVDISIVVLTDRVSEKYAQRYKNSAQRAVA